MMKKVLTTEQKEANKIANKIANAKSKANKSANDELRAKLTIEANELLKNGQFKPITLKNLKYELASGKILKLQKLVETLKMSKNLDKNKDSYGISQVQIKKLDKQHLKEITAFNKKYLIENIN